MSKQVISDAAKIKLIDEIKRDLANDANEQHDTAAYGRVGVYKMTQEQLLAEFSNYGIDPYEV
jgi:hypothetical protein